MAQGFVFSRVWYQTIKVCAISPTKRQKPHTPARGNSATCHSRENGSLTLVRNITWLRTSAPRLQCADRTGVALYYPLRLAAVARTGRSCIVHAAATASGPLGTGQPGTASRVKVAIKGGEASELECHIEGLLRQRGAPGGGEG